MEFKPYWGICLCIQPVQAWDRGITRKQAIKVKKNRPKGTKNRLKQAHFQQHNRKTYKNRPLFPTMVGENFEI